MDRVAVNVDITTAVMHQEETVHHFLLDCPSYRFARFKVHGVLGRSSKSLKDLLGGEEAVEVLLQYVADTRRLKDIFGDVSPLPPTS